MGITDGPLLSIFDIQYITRSMIFHATRRNHKLHLEDPYYAGALETFGATVGHVFQGTEVCMITFQTNFDESIYICFYYTYKEYMRMDRARGE